MSIEGEKNEGGQTGESRPIPDTPQVGKVKKSEELWLMSFSDMSMVMLCFFVLLISRMSERNQPLDNVQVMEGTSAVVSEPQETQKVQELAKKVRHIVKNKGLEKSAKVTVRDKGIYIEFSDGMFFQSGSAITNPKFKKVTKQVMTVIAQATSDFDIKIEGHTDDTPTGGGAYPSNWELSASRAISVMRMFHHLKVPKEHISVQAFAETRPRVPYKTLRGIALRKARDKNRRVAIWLHLKEEDS